MQPGHLVMFAWHGFTAQKIEQQIFAIKKENCTTSPGQPVGKQ